MSKLQLLRKHAGMSQSQLAARSGLSVRVIQHYEQGGLDINKAAAITVWRLAHALDCQVADLLDIPDEELLAEA